MSFNIQKKSKCKSSTFGLIEVNSQPSIVGDGFILNGDGSVTWVHNLNITNYDSIMFSPFVPIESLTTPDSITFLVDYMQSPTVVSLCSLSNDDLYIRNNLPIARVNSSYQGLTAFGDFTGSFELTDYLGTSLQTGDQVSLDFVSRNGTFIASATFLYGDNIATATPISENGFTTNIQPYFSSTALLQNGGTFTLLKKPLIFNFNNGKLAGINKGEELKIYIRATQTTSGLKSVNDDNFTTLITLRESVYYTSSVGRATSLPGITPNNPNTTGDYVLITARGNSGYSVSDLLSVPNQDMNYGHYYNNTAGVLENLPVDSVTGVISKTTGFFAPSIFVPYWITLAGTSNNVSGFYKRHRSSVGIDNYPLLNNQSISNTVEQVSFIKNTTYRIAYNVHTPLNTPISINENISYSLVTFSSTPFASAPPSLFSKVETWVSSVPNQDPLLGTKIADFIGNNANQVNSFTSTGDGEYIVLTRGLDASNNVIAYTKSLLIQISY